MRSFSIYIYIYIYRTALGCVLAPPRDACPVHLHPLIVQMVFKDEITSIIRRLIYDDGFYDHGGHTNEILEDVEEMS